MASGRSPPSTDPLLDARVGGRYRLVQRIATGGVGRIYLAVDEGSPEAADLAEGEEPKRAPGRVPGPGAPLVAVKVLRPEHRGRADLVARFRREAEAASRIEHPAVLRVRGTGAAPGGLPFFAMDLLEGTDLADALDRAGHLPAEQAARIAAGVADGLAAAHAAGVVHRDVKPENIFLRRLPDGRNGIMLLDFGFARLPGDPSGPRSRARSSVVGTPEYMAPEQAQGARADASADLYSLGVVLYEMLAGRLPFTGDYPAIALRHVHEPPPPLREAMGGRPLSAELEALVGRALAKDPSSRHPSASALLAALLAAPELALGRPGSR